MVLRGICALVCAAAAALFLGGRQEQEAGIAMIGNEGAAAVRPQSPPGGTFVLSGVTAGPAHIAS